MESAEYGKMYEMEARHWYFTGKYAVLESLLERLLPEPRATTRILDVGCGTGGMLQRLARFGGVCGIDMSSEAVEFCRRRAGADVRVATGDDIPYPEASFDAVCAFDIFEHLPDETRMLAEVRRVLKPGGILFLTVPAYQFLWSEHDTALHHHRRYRAEGIKRLMAKNGFILRRLSYFNTLLLPAAICFRLGRKLFKSKGPGKSDFFVTLPAAVNGVFARLFAVERVALKAVDLPFGLSIFCAAAPGDKGAEQ
jgi:SAM-dependent methyltransferase